MRAVIDKIEGKKAELRLGPDEAITLVLPIAALPKGVREGDVLRLTFERDLEATRREAAANDALRAKIRALPRGAFLAQCPQAPIGRRGPLNAGYARINDVQLTTIEELACLERKTTYDFSFVSAHR